MFNLLQGGKSPLEDGADKFELIGITDDTRAPPSKRAHAPRPPLQMIWHWDLGHQKTQRSLSTSQTIPTIKLVQSCYTLG